MISPFLAFTSLDPQTKSKSRGVIHMDNIESVLDNNGRATIYSTSGIAYLTNAKWLTVMACWEKYQRQLQETSSISPNDIDDDEDEDEIDAQTYES